MLKQYRNSFLLVLVLILGFSINSLSQSFLIYENDTINQINVSNQKQGTWVIFDASGQNITAKGSYLDNKKEGSWITYYPNGLIKHEITFVKGLANGPAKFYYNTGQLWEEGTWIIDHWSGSYRFYYPSGKVAYDWNYNKIGKRQGEQKYYHDNGNLKFVGSWDNGVNASPLKMFDQDGKLMAERVYQDGNFEKQVPLVSGQSDSSPTTRFNETGEYTIYNLSGQIEKKGYFKEGQLINGEHFIYDTSGLISTKLVFENGLLKKTMYYQNGKLVKS